MLSGAVRGDPQRARRVDEHARRLADRLEHGEPPEAQTFEAFVQRDDAERGPDPVRDAQRAGLRDKSLGEGSPERNQVSPFGQSSREVLAERLATDSVFARDWQSTAIRRAFAIEVIRFRVEHHLTQEQLAEELDVPVDLVGRLEVGE